MFKAGRGTLHFFKCSEYFAYYQLLVGAYAYFVLSIPEQFLLSISDFQNASNEFFELFFNNMEGKNESLNLSNVREFISSFERRN